MDDFDGDGVQVEMTAGRVSALTLKQASLATPSRSLPRDAQLLEKIRLGRGDSKKWDVQDVISRVFRCVRCGFRNQTRSTAPEALCRRMLKECW